MHHVPPWQTTVARPHALRRLVRKRTFVHSMKTTHPAVLHKRIAQ
jgi:hypothetical protein